LAGQQPPQSGHWGTVVCPICCDELADLGLTEREVDNIVAFTKTLTDGWQPAIIKL